MKIRLKLTDPDRIVPNPEDSGKPIPAEGAAVKEPLSRYWRRRIKAGDVVLASEADTTPIHLDTPTQDEE